MNLKLPKTLVLDYKTWRCGKDGCLANAHGEGNTLLKNAHGFECCLGQFAKQAGIPEKELYSVGNPADLDIMIDGLATRDRFNHKHETKLTVKCITINDDTQTSIAEKVKKLKNVLGKSKYKLKLANFPQAILDTLTKMGVKNVVTSCDKAYRQKMSHNARI